MLSFLRRRWAKNWPDVLSLIRGGVPRFVFSDHPAALGDSVPVFCYHTVDRSSLDADLRFLAENGYRSISADALLGHLLRIEPAPDRAVVLSFDDGPANLHEVVFPLLRAHEVTAVAFIAPSFHPDTTREPASGRPCSWEEIREMHDSGFVDFQSHTFEHRFIPGWPEPARLTGVRPEHHRYSEPRYSIEDDFRLAREAIESRLNKTVQHLAFPRFAGTPEAVRAGQGCGYRGFWWGALSAQPANRPGDDGTRIVRLSAEFVRRLPGHGRVRLASILRDRYANPVARWRFG